MVSNIICKVVVIFILIVGLNACHDPYHGFGCIAPESHPAVAHARSLSQAQLQKVYVEVQKLSIKHAPKNYETQFIKGDIPDDLLFLKAELISVYQSGGPYIILANCFDERIELRLSSSDQSPSVITLYWAEPTNENPYATGKQVLWQVGSKL